MDSEALRLLLILRERGSLSAVAKQLDVAVSTVARRLESLEGDLQLRLLDRRSNGVRLSEDGARIAAMAMPLVDQAQHIERAALALRQQGTAGHVTISATEFVVSELLAPALPRLWASAPGLAVTLKSQGEVVSLAARAADLSVRMSTPQEPGLIGKRIGDVPLGCYASPDYLAGRDPGALHLNEERLLVYDDSYGRIAELDWVAALRLSGAVVMRSGSTRALINACAAGAGVALLPARQAERAGLIAVPLATGLPPRPVWLLTHPDARRLPTVRAAHRWIAETFRRAA